SRDDTGVLMQNILTAIHETGNVGIGNTNPGTYKLNVTGTLLASGAITLSNYTTNGGVLYTDATGLVAQSTAGTGGQCLQSSGGGAPTWGACGDSIGPDSLNFTDFSDTLSL